MMKDKKNRKIDMGALLRGSFRLPRMSEPKRFWNAFRAKAELTPQDRESRMFGASERPSRMVRWNFSKVVAGVLVLFALYTLIEDHFFGPSPEPEPIEVAEEEVTPETPPDPPILYDSEVDEEEPAELPEEQQLRREEESLDEMPRRRLREPQPAAEAEMEELERAEPPTEPAEKEAPALSMDALAPGPAEVKELRVRLISLHEEEKEISEESLSDLLPLLERDYDRQSYRVEKGKTFKPEPGKTVKLGRGLMLAVEEVDDSQVILRLRGRRTVDGKKKDPLQKDLQTPLTEPLIVGPFQGRTGKNYILALTVDE